MSNKFPLALALLAVTTASAWVAACSSDNATTPTPDGGKNGEGKGQNG